MSKTLTTEEVLVALAAGKTLERDDIFFEKPMRISLDGAVLQWEPSGSVVINPWRQITEEAWHLVPKKVSHTAWLVLHPNGMCGSFCNEQQAKDNLLSGAELREITWEVEVDDV